MDILITGFYGLVYIILSFGFSVVFRIARKQRIPYRRLFTQAVLGGVVFMLLLTLLGATV
jgi:uncharacterized BrkB/YihY/UPF0761 family membrane protein